jgi:hypothetical protein
MDWEVIFTDELGTWWDSLSLEEQLSVDRVVGLLAGAGPSLSFPYCSGIAGSAFSSMRELRIQHEGQPYRVLYIFDPKRRAVLLIGGNKIGDDRWYEKHIAMADNIYRQYLKEIGEDHAS